MSIIRAPCDRNYELVKSEELFTCYGCKTKGIGERYTCNRCRRHELHGECMYPDSEISHEFFGSSIFKFQREPFTKDEEYAKYCDACGKDVCGFSYHCETKKLDLHPCCRNLKEKISRNNMIFNLKARVKSKCAWCNHRKNVPGWSYVSSCKKYTFHVYCMNEMVQDACLKSGNTAVEKMDMKNVIKSKKAWGGGNSVFETIKLFIKIILSTFLGDPTMMISNIVVELVARGLQY